ncbi:phosphoglycerate kinase [Pelagibacterium flavum]|uniref:Phosphoglycerate kinase n=1 Tax=Pelagibacterium flavum TaxID=2984530 RepID=A0ABY6IUC4_9HYPH|nr:phosphoglycerate kinase [Pelagibacterium sp. YIM 151497]UYQ73017.1 phosphoglycerate kinase [Pelagibacterium sp. YIM 151497]
MTAAFKTLDDFEFDGKRVLVRVDLNVPVKDGKVGDTTRIERVAHTIQEIANKGGLPILLAHFGRPKGKVDPEMSLKVVVDALHRIIGKPVHFAPTDWTDVSQARKVIDGAEAGSVVLMENTRFHPGEEKNDPELVATMASLGDLYVNDAFSAAHRAHASTTGLAQKLPAAAGRAMGAELKALEAGLGNPQKPVIAIVGGAKVSSKIDLLENLVTKVEALVIGGGMANTFIYALGYDVGKSLCERDLKETALRIMDKAEEARCAIILPIDGVVAWHFKADTPSRVYGLDAIDKDGMVLDAGPQSVEKIKTAINEARTIVWNGPLGAFEMTPFDKATVEVARHAAERTKKGLLTSVAGGGDTVAALAHAGVKDSFTYVSTAGGAFLEWMEGKPLPGVDALAQGQG